MTDILIEAFIFLLAAIITVPISKRLGLGSVLGYLIAGMIIGPALGLVGEEAQDIQHVAEFGVVMMLLLVGLELEPRKLWDLRHKLLGLGGLQVGITTLLIFAIGLFFDLPWTMALAIGLILSLSSTAIVLQTLGEQGLLKTQGGQSSFSVLLFQDIAVIPMLALLPLLALPELASHTDVVSSHSTNLLHEFAPWQKGLITLGAIALIIFGGHFLAQPIFRFIAQSQLREMFTAFALLLVIGISALMSIIGLSPALGTFLAGVVLANSEYRHELVSNIEPFKGLLLGIFFITVGVGIDFDLLSSEWMIILGMTLGVIAVKVAVLFTLGKIFKLKGADHWLFALCLAQAGEFGFVLLSFTVQNAILPVAIADKLLLVIALSMMLTPLLFIVIEKVIFPRHERATEQAMDHIEPEENIIIAGTGRFGQMIHRMLVNCGYKPTVIDLDIRIVEGHNRLGYKTYFGDASRHELLAAAGIDEAELMVIAIDDKEKALEIAHHVNKIRPDLPIVARAFDRLHTYDMYNAGARDIVRETFDSSIRAGRLCLINLGLSKQKATEIADVFYHRDRYSVLRMADKHDPSLPPFANTEMSLIAKEINEETAQIIKALLDR